MKTHIIGWYVMQLKHILNLSWRTSGTEHTSISPVYLQTGGLHVALLYHGMQQRFLQGSLWLTNYSLKWKCSYSLMKLSAQIRHKSHSVLFCPLNHYSVWVPGFCVLSKHANMFFLFSLYCERHLRTWSCRKSFIAPLNCVNWKHVYLRECLLSKAIYLIQ